MDADPYAKRFEMAPFHQELALADEIASGAHAEAQPKAQRRLSRIRSIIERIQLRLNAVDGALVSRKAIEQLRATLTNANGQLRQHLADASNIASLDLALELFEQHLVPEVFALPSHNTAEQATLLASERYAAEVDKFRAHLEEVAATYMTTRQNLLEREASLVTLDKTITEQTHRITAQNERLDSAVAQMNQHTATLEREREQRFQTWTKDKADDVSQTFGELRRQLDSIVSASNVSSKKVLEELQELRRQAATTVNVIGNIAATGDYKAVADANTKDANRLRSGAVALLLLLVGVVTYVVFSFDTTLGWQHVVYRLSAALLLLVPAGYLAVESTRHREVARRMQRIELEVASIDAFTALLPIEQRHNLKAELTKKYFGNMTEPSGVAGSDMTAKELLKELRLMLKAFQGRKDASE